MGFFVLAIGVINFTDCPIAHGQVELSRTVLSQL